MIPKWGCGLIWQYHGYLALGPLAQKSAKEVVHSGENVVRVGLKSEFPVHWVIEPTDIMEVKRFHSG